MKTLSGRQVFFRFALPAGPMTIKAGIGLSSEPSDGLSILASDGVAWPDGCDYMDAVSEEIIEVVRHTAPRPFGATIRVTEIDFCEIGSSENAFRTSAREAAKALLSVGPFIDFTTPRTL